MKLKFIHLLLCAFIFTQQGFAQTTIAQWLTTGVSNYGPTTLAPTTANSNVTIGGVTRFNAATSGTAANNAWGGSGWDSDNGYVEFSFEANSGFNLSLSSLVLQYRRSSSGPSTGELTYSISTNGGISFGSLVPIISFSFPSNGGTGAVLPTVNLSTISALQNLPNGTVVRFRIALTGASSSAGTWYIIGNEGLSVSGTVTPINIAAPTSASAAPLCEGNLVTLRIQGATNDYRVYDAPTGGNIVEEGDSVITFLNIRSSTTLYVAALSGTLESVDRLPVAISIRPVNRDTIRQTICSGASFTFLGNTYNSAITVSDTAVNVLGCDSITTLVLSVNPPLRDTISRTICAGGTFLFNNSLITMAGTYIDTIANASGCDSITVLTLIVNRTDTSRFSITTCDTEPYTFNGAQLNISGTYLDTLQNTTGCDSLIVLSLTVNESAQTRLFRTICSNESFSFAGNIITSSGVYNDTLAAVNTCDSVVILTLTVEDALATPVISISSRNDSLRANTPADSYIWLLNNQVVANETSNRIAIRSNGAYRVVAVATNTCQSDTSNAFVVTNAADYQYLYAPKVFPTAFTNSLSITQLEEGITHDLNIYNLQGKLIYTSSLDSNGEITLGDFAKGVYILELRNAKGLRFKQRVVRQ